MRKQLIAAVLTILGGIAVYWFTTGIQERRYREEQRQESLRQEQEKQEQEATLAKQREQEQQRADAERRQKELEEAAKKPRMSEPEMDINREGSDYKDFVAKSLEECLQVCTLESKCVAITFTKSSRQCWMKSSVPLRTPNTLYISAVKTGGS